MEARDVVMTLGEKLVEEYNEKNRYKELWEKELNNGSALKSVLRNVQEGTLDIKDVEINKLPGGYPF